MAVLPFGACEVAEVDNRRQLAQFFFQNRTGLSRPSLSRKQAANERKVSDAPHLS